MAMAGGPRAKPKTTIAEAAIVAFAFNADRTRCVLCPNNHQLLVVDCGAGGDCAGWPTVATLEAHGQTVSAVAWDPHTDRILSVAHDRTAFVWSRPAAAEADAAAVDESAPRRRRATELWVPSLVLLDAQMKRGFTDCAWASAGRKLYVSCASGSVAMGTYDADSDWWQCRTARLHDCGVTRLAPCPALSTVLATGGTDRKVVFMSTYSKSVDDAEDRLAKTGTELGAVAVSAIVDGLAWAPSGVFLAVATRDSRFAVVQAPSADSRSDFGTWAVAHVVALRNLPLRSLLATSDTVVVGGGFDFYPLALERASEDPEAPWTVSRVGTEPKKAAAEASGTAAVRAMLQNEAAFGARGAVDMPKSRHSNTIVQVLPWGGAGGFVTASLDGRVETWTVGQMESAAKAP